MSDEKKVWQCPRCGKTMPPFLCMRHYAYCCMGTPPEKQPGRQDDIYEQENLIEEAEKFAHRWWD